VEVLHYSVSLVGISFFSSDTVIPADSLVIAYFAVFPLMWSWGIYFEKAQPFWERCSASASTNCGKVSGAFIVAARVSIDLYSRGGLVFPIA